MATHLLFDIGGTKIRLAPCKDGVIGDIVTIKNPSSYTDALQEISQALKDFSLEEGFSGGAGGVAGLLNKEKSKLFHAPHLVGWVGKDLKLDLEKITGGSVFLENDSAIVGLGEAHFGAGKDFDIVMYMTVSTGVGGSRIVGGKIDASLSGFEPGHQIIDFSGAVEPRFNVTGTLENFISGSAVSSQLGKSVVFVPSQDPLWDDLAEKTAYGIYNSILHWSPHVVVLGGSMITGSPAIPLDAISAYLREINQIYPELPLIKKATLKDVGGIHGASIYLKQHLS